MSAEGIEINIDVVESSISELGKLSGKIDESTKGDFQVLGAGYTRDYMELINNNFLALTNSLQYMINNTIEFLENAKDGYVDTDENTAETLKILMEDIQGGEINN